MANEHTAFSRDSPTNSRRDNKKRVRSFFLVTYASEDSVLECINKRRESIKHYAYCVHDKDKDREIHTHILLRLNDAFTLSQVLKWFSDCIDEKGEKVNTFGEIVEDFGYCFRYLIHGNKADSHKFQYSTDRRKVSDSNYFQKYAIEPNVYRDSIKDAVIGIVTGEKNIEQCVLEYGRDFIIHIDSIIKCLRLCNPEFFKKMK